MADRLALVDRINSGLAELRQRDAQLSLNDWADYFSFGGNTYPFVQTTMGQIDRESVGVTSVGAYKGSSPVFALVLARLQAFSQVRFQWTRFQGSQPTDLFGTPELAVLERPSQGWTTSDLLARMEIHVSAAGNAYVHRPRRDRLALLRPDRVTIVMGSQTDADNPAEAPDVEVIGYLHQTSRGRLTVFDAGQVAHYAPYPDPDAVFLGMSWVTPALRECQADSLAVEHKARFFTNAATPNLAIKFDATVGIEKVKQFKALLESEHKGTFNAWKTLYLGGGADPVPVGSTFQQMDYAVIQGRAESRLASDAGVPPSWVGFAEGLQGSSLNAGNFNSARRRFSDGTMVHLWTNAATSLEVILDKPRDRTGNLINGASLWYDPRVPFMREDAQDLAGIQQQQAATIVSLSTGGFTRESAIAAVTKNDFTLLVKDPNWVSVQLQQSSGQSGGQPPSGNPPSNPPSNGKPLAVKADPKASAAIAARAFNPDEPRGPDGKWIGGLSELGHALERDWSRVVRDIQDGDRDQVHRELDVQAELTPKAAARLRGVRGDPTLAANVNGVYHQDRHEISLNSHTMLGHAGPKTQTKNAAKGAVARISHAGPDRSDLQSTLAHEYGHHVDYMVRDAGTRQQLFDKLAAELGVKPPKDQGLGDMTLDHWVTKNSGRISKAVSQYATTNSRELMAEIWREYSTNPDARPVVKAVGDLMRQLSEAG